MITQVELGDITLDVFKKDIKNLHLSVYPPFGKVRISAPLRMDLKTIRVYAISKLGWIKQQRKKLREQERETPREYLDRESHYLWGRRYLLQMIEKDAAPAVTVKHRALRIQMRSMSDEKKGSVLDAWYRTQLRDAVIPVVNKWEPLMGVTVARVLVQRMKTRWGSCNHVARNIRLNTDLAKKPPQCLEYIVVHEMAHLLEPTHNRRFIELMERFLPKWRQVRDELNRLPVRHERWTY